jgi:hypothetical protein
MPASLRSRPRRLPLAAAAFGVNLAWEVGHRPLYRCPFSSRVLAGAAAVDAAITVGMADAAALSGRRYALAFWPVFAIGLAGAAIAIEACALVRGRRFYGPSMPTVGGLGLIPLFQLPLAGGVAVEFALSRSP